MKSYGMVKRRTSSLNGEKKEDEVSCYISSLPGNLHQFAKGARGHWGIESMHWSLDVVLNEDRRIVRKDHGAQNLALLKRLALNLIRSYQTFPKSTGSQKWFYACWDTDYLEAVLRQL